MRMPGLWLVCPHDWVMADDAFAGQLALRERLVAECRDAVIGCLPEAGAAAQELLEALLHELPEQGWHRAGDILTRPDGVRVKPDRDDPLGSCARLVQEDFAILQPDGQGAHVMTAGVVCFPALWTLREKLGRTLGGLHAPVASFDADMTGRVERVFASLRPEIALQRGNVLIYTDARLHQPAREGAPKILAPGRERLVRIERQTLRRLPVSGAVVFSIHTCLMPVAWLTEQDRSMLVQLRPEAVSGG
jgi:hypothetical protein